MYFLLSLWMSRWCFLARTRTEEKCKIIDVVRKNLIIILSFFWNVQSEVIYTNLKMYICSNHKTCSSFILMIDIILDRKVYLYKRQDHHQLPLESFSLFIWINTFKYFEQWYLDWLIGLLSVIMLHWTYLKRIRGWKRSTV